MLSYFQSRIIAAFFLGFSCGIPIALIISTLNSWLAIAGINRTTIGLFAMVGIPYTIKFLWSPIIDNVRIPFLYQKLGHRRSWLLLIQIFLFFAIIKLGFSDPIIDIYNFALWAVIVAIFSSTQEMIIEAYRVEILEENQQGMGAASFVFGARIGLLLSSGGALLLIDSLCNYGHVCENFAQWTIAYIMFATLSFVGVITTFIMGESKLNHKKIKIAYKKNIFKYLSEVIHTYIITPLLEIMHKHNWYLILIFVVTYRLCDAFISSMLNPFFLDLGFTLTEIGIVSKTFGFIATTIGTVVGGILINYFGMIKSLFIAGLAQMLSNAMFIIQAKVGYNMLFLYLSVAAESIGGGMATAVFIAYISSLCINSKHTATRYALLTSLASIDVIFSSIFAGWISDSFGWTALFSISIVLGVPPLILLYYLKKNSIGNNQKI